MSENTTLVMFTIIHCQLDCVASYNGLLIQEVKSIQTRSRYKFTYLKVRSIKPQSYYESTYLEVRSIKPQSYYESTYLEVRSIKPPSYYESTYLEVRSIKPRFYYQLIEVRSIKAIMNQLI